MECCRNEHRPELRPGEAASAPVAQRRCGEDQKIGGADENCRAGHSEKQLRDGAIGGYE